MQCMCKMAIETKKQELNHTKRTEAQQDRYQNKSMKQGIVAHKFTH